MNKSPWQYRHPQNLSIQFRIYIIICSIFTFSMIYLVESNALKINQLNQSTDCVAYKTVFHSFFDALQITECRSLDDSFDISNALFNWIIYFYSHSGCIHSILCCQIEFKMWHLGLKTRRSKAFVQNDWLVEKKKIWCVNLCNCIFHATER